MPSTYTGNGTGFDATTPIQISAPVDGDPRNAASLQDLVQKAANWLDFFRTSAGLLASAREWTALQTFFSGIHFGMGSESSPSIEMGTNESTNYTLVMRLGDAGSATRLRVYRSSGGGFVVTRNAQYSGFAWYRDAAGDSFKVTLGLAGITVHRYGAAGASPFGDGAWVGATIDAALVTSLSFQYSSAQTRQLWLGPGQFARESKATEMAFFPDTNAWYLADSNPEAWVMHSSFRLPASALITGVSLLLRKTSGSAVDFSSYLWKQTYTAGGLAKTVSLSADPVHTSVTVNASPTYFSLGLVALAADRQAPADGDGFFHLRIGPNASLPTGERVGLFGARITYTTNSLLD